MDVDYEDEVVAAALFGCDGACAVGGAWLYRTGFTKGAASVRAEWDAERAAQLAALAEQQMKARQREKALTDALEKQRLERRREVDRIVREHQRIVEEGATGPKPVPVMEVCPRAPPLELDVPARDWQGEMQNFLQGILPTPPDYSLHSTPPRLPTMK